jgi:hypothetical protein
MYRKEGYTANYIHSLTRFVVPHQLAPVPTLRQSAGAVAHLLAWQLTQGPAMGTYVQNLMDQSATKTMCYMCLLEDGSNAAADLVAQHGSAADSVSDGQEEYSEGHARCNNYSKGGVHTTTKWWVQ